MFVSVLTISQHCFPSLQTPHDYYIFQQDMQCTYKHNNEARLCNHCCGRDAIRITYSNKTCNVLINITMRRVYATIVAVETQYVLHILSVCLALVIQQAVRMRHIICDLPRNKFFHIIS